MRVTEGESGTRVLVGRERELEQVKLALTDPHPHVLLLHGPALVGKRCLLLQAVEDLRVEREHLGGHHVIKVDCSAASDWPAVMLAICQAVGLEDRYANENLLAGEVRHRFESSRVNAGGGGGRLMVLLGVNGMECTGRDVDSLALYAHALTYAGVTTVMTSRRRLQLPSCLEVPPLSRDDAIQLLRHLAPDVDVTAYADLVERHCHGLPPLVMRLARLVGGQSTTALSPTEISQALAKDPDLLMEGLEKEGDTLFQSMSSEVQGHVTQIVQLLGGRFSLDVLRAITGDEEDAPRTKIVVRRLCDEGPLIINTTSQQLCVQPLLVHHIRRMGHMDADDQARFRVITFLGRVLSHAENNLYLEGQNTIYGHLHGDWPHLEHLLRQAIHCTWNTYPAFLQVALGADRLLVKCYPQEALQFYKDMSVAAVRFGTPHDQAVLQGLMGMAITQGQGTEWMDALRFFDSALNVLQRDRRSVRLVQLLCDTGIAYFRLNRHQEADRYLRNALEASTETEVEDDRQLEFLLVRIRCFLALPAMFRGFLEDSKQLLLETLELCSQVMPHHPDKAILVNSLGLVYERSGESQDLALQYYKQSLAERRQYASVAECDLVPTLNNVGMQYCRRRNFELAIRHLEEAAEIRARHGRWHYYTALTQQHLGQVCLQRGEFRRAHEHLTEAACVYARCTPGHDAICKVALCRAHVYLVAPCRDIDEARKQLRQVQELAAKAGNDLTDTALLVLLSAVEHTVQLLGWRSPAARSLLVTIIQQVNRFEGDPSQQLREHQSILDAMVTLANAQSEVTPDQNEALTARVLCACQMCHTLAECVEDVRALWRQAEEEVQGRKMVLDRLRSSIVLKRVTRLSVAHQESQSGGSEGRTHAQGVRPATESAETVSSISSESSRYSSLSSEDVVAIDCGSTRLSVQQPGHDITYRLTVPQQETSRDQNQGGLLLITKNFKQLCLDQEDQYVTAVQSQSEWQDHMTSDCSSPADTRWGHGSSVQTEPHCTTPFSETASNPVQRQAPGLGASHGDVSRGMTPCASPAKVLLPSASDAGRSRNLVFDEQRRALEKLAVQEPPCRLPVVSQTDSKSARKLTPLSESSFPGAATDPVSPAAALGTVQRLVMSESVSIQQADPALCISPDSSCCDASWSRVVAECVRSSEMVTEPSSQSNTKSQNLGAQLVLQDQAAALANFDTGCCAGLSSSGDGSSQHVCGRAQSPPSSGPASSHSGHSREPSENDERLEDPSRSCRDADCDCSYSHAKGHF